MANDPTASIAVIQGAETPVIQALLRDFVARQRPFASIAGVIEEDVDLAGDGCGAGQLRNIRDGALFTIFQDLGAGSEACNLDPAGVVAACEAARRDIEAGCDLVVLNKFGKLEADRSGLADAFAAAFAAGAPILTSVSPRMIEAWTRFASPCFVILPPDPERIDAWWRAARQAQTPIAASAG